MSHLDEGQLHALLDGEMDEGERTAAEAHLAACAECRREYAEAKTFLAEAETLIEAVDLPAANRAQTTTVRRAPPPFKWRNLAWAASLVAAVGLGWMARADQFRVAEKDSFERPAHTAPSAARSVDSSVSEDKAKPEQDERPMPASAPSLGDKARERRKSTARLEDAGTVATAAGASNTTLTQPPTARNEPAPARDAPLALPMPVTRPADLDRAKSADSSVEDRLVSSRAVAEERVANRTDQAFAAPVAPSAAAPAPKESEVRRNDGLAAATGAGSRGGGIGGFQVTPMEGAVRILGGSIRLVDGMTPTRVEVGAGRLAADANPGLEIVRVVYDDPPGRELWLDQQRPATEGGDAAVHGQQATTLLPGDTLLTVDKAGSRSLRWIHQTGFRLELTGFLPADSLRVLARRVQ